MLHIIHILSCIGTPCDPTQPLRVTLKTSNMQVYADPRYAPLLNKNMDVYLRSPDFAPRRCGDTVDTVIKRDYNPFTTLATEG